MSGVHILPKTMAATPDGLEASRCKDLSILLARFPRVKLGHLPTPLEPMDRLSDILGGPRIWVKRDDCTGLSSGRNKTRKLEFLMADALAQGADTIITQGTTHCNHARQTAAAAAKLGMACHILFEDRSGYCDPNGNMRMGLLHGARVCKAVSGTEMNAEMEKIARQVRADGHFPYIIPDGGSNTIGSLGYVNCARELTEQALSMGLKIDAVVHATGNGGTQAGLLAGLAAIESKIHLLGIAVRAAQEHLEQMVHTLAVQTALCLGARIRIDRNEVRANCDYMGSGHGYPMSGMKRAIKLLAETEGLLFDPACSGKGLDGMIDLIDRGYFQNMENIVFLHTGGSAALCGNADPFDLQGYAQ